MTGYWIAGFFLGLIVAFDGARRLLGAKALLWMIGSFILWPIVTPLYFAKRPLRKDERRAGGTFWQWVRGFVGLWTLAMIGMALIGLAGVSMTTTVENDAELVGTTIGTGIGLGMICAFWFMPTLVLLVLGLVAKTDTVEEGPTGPFAEIEGAEEA